MDSRALRKSRSEKVCMTCQHFGYAVDSHCHTLLTCRLHQCLVPQGDHLTKKCRNWMLRRELQVGWCPEVA